ncbi:MAG TPA: FAD-dependent oxidoreductase [Longimicrobiaceae bacterium]
MGSDQTGSSGVDLTGGIPLETLEEGRPFAGQVGEEPVVLVRRGAEVFAVGGSCTHYGGPLAEGLVVGDTMRCPWHHACFSLRTGEAIKAPALNPIPCWQTEVRDGRVHLVGRREAAPLDSLGRRVDFPESVLIVGSGAAGSAAAEMLRREGYTGPVTVIDPDGDAPYDRPNLSKDYLAGEAPEEWIPLRPEGFYEEHGIERISTAARSIDPTGRQIELADGRVLSFGALLLATGSKPVRLTVPGGDLPHVRLLRSLTDCRAIIRAAESAKRAVVVGASFIGMEAAASLRNRGLEVTVVAPDTVPFQHNLGPEIGRVLMVTHERNGVQFRLGRKVERIDANAVHLDDGTQLPAELVVVGIGVRPLTQLAEDAGIEVDNGVLVNEYLESSAPGIFAAGDIARYPDPRSGERIRVEHWVAAQRQGQAAARNILGRRQPFIDPAFFWTRQWGVGVRYVGYAARWDEVEIEGDLSAGDAEVHYLRDGRRLAVATMGRDLNNLRAEAEMEAAASGYPAGGVV